MPSLSLFDGKVCQTCGLWCPLSDFWKSASHPDGLQKRCIPCFRAYREKNAEAIRTYKRDYAQAHDDEIRQYRRDYYAVNRDMVQARNDAWHEANSERYRARRFEYRRLHRDEINEKRRVQRLENIEHKRLLERAAYARRKAQKRQNGGNLTAQEWREVCERYDWRCLACGTTERLTLDHIVPVVKGGPSSVDNVQPLCLACNLRKRFKIIDYRPPACKE